MARFRSRLFAALLLLVFLPGFAGLVSIFLCDRTIERAATGRHTARIEELPQAEAALVLGCAATVAGGRRANLYFTARMDAAARLYHSGKCRHFLVSGDNGRRDYDETSQMQAALIARGIPAGAIVRDHAGFDTLDSVVRAREVFGLDSLLIVSQQFQNERALYIAQSRGIDAFGWNANDIAFPGGWKTRVREKLARVKTILEVHVLGGHPKYLGPRLPMASKG